MRRCTTFRAMRALVTGASGFVGQHLIKYLLGEGDEVCACFLPGTSYPDLLSDPSLKVSAAQKSAAEKANALTWYPLDIASLDDCRTLFNQIRPEVVYHLAGISFVPQAEDDFMGALAANVAGVNNITRVAHELNSGVRVVLAGSADVYGKVTHEQLPVSEETLALPVNAYSTTKLMAEIVADRWHRLGQVSVVVLRPFNHIGPAQDFRFVAPGFSKQLVMISKGLQDARIQVGNLSARKDFTDVRDVVRAYRSAALIKSRVDRCERFVICSGKSVPVQAILDGLIEVSALEVEVTSDPARMRQAEVPELYGSYAKAERELGWTPRISLQESLRDIYADVLKRVSNELEEPRSEGAS